MTEAPNSSERLATVETSVRNLHDDLNELKATVKAGLRDIEQSMSRGKQPNWTVIFGFVGIVAGLYAAAIKPIASDAERLRVEATELAKAVLVQNDKITSLSVNVASRVGLLEYKVGGGGYA